jgi:hypothetical protein
MRQWMHYLPSGLKEFWRQEKPKPRADCNRTALLQKRMRHVSVMQRCYRMRIASPRMYWCGKRMKAGETSLFSFVEAVGVVRSP